MDDCIEKKLKIIENIEASEKLFEEIKGSKYGKDM